MALNNDDEAPLVGETVNIDGLVTMKPPKKSKTDVALTADSVRVELELNATPSANAREGLDLVAVLDVSGSMQDKIASVKTAMQFVIMKLTEKDRLSIVTFSGQGARLCPLRKMDAKAQADLKAIVAGLAANGGTNIKDGLEKGLAVANGRVFKDGRTANVFLMSDGVQTDGNARDVDPGNVAVYTFGFGKDSDHQLLTDIAKKSTGGTFSTVPDGAKLIDPFSLLVGGLTTIVAQDVTLTVTSRVKDVEKMVVAPGVVDYKNTTTVDAAGQTVITFSFGTIFSTEKRTVSIDFTLKPSPRKTKFTATLAEYVHGFNAQRDKQPENAKNIVIDRTPKPKTAPSVDTPEMHAEQVRNQVAAAIGEARGLADAGKLDDARYKLQNALNEVENIALDDGGKMAAALRAELQQLIKYMASAELYKELGRPYALAAETSHGRQRSAGKGDKEPTGLYDTPRMVRCVQQAKEFEKNPAAPVPSADEDVKQEIADNPLAAVAAPLALYLKNAIEALQAIQKILAPTA